MARDPGGAAPPPDEFRASETAEPFAPYAADPVAFAREILGQTPWSRQAEIMRAVAAAPQTTVRSSHGVGKTWVAAVLALWWVYTRRPSLVLTTAPTARQVEGLLWAEINRLWTRANDRRRGALTPSSLIPHPSSLALPGHCLQTKLEAHPDQQALGLTTNEPERFAGWHSEHLLVIVDEASGVPDRLFEVIQGTLTTADCRLLLIGNPTRAEGLFFRSHHTDGWKKLKISAYDTPNFGFRISDFGLPATAGEPEPLVHVTLSDPIQNPKSKIQNPKSRALPLPRHPRLGRAAAQGMGRGLGRVPRARPRRVPPRLRRHPDRPRVGRARRRTGTRCRARRAGPLIPHPSSLIFGLDVARFGDCETVLAVRRGDTLVALERWAGADLMATCGRVVDAARREPPAQIVVDAVGLGAGVVDRLREIQREGALPGCEIVAFASGERAQDPARFHSRRDEAYWELRRRYQDGEIVHAAAWSALTGQFTSLRYRYTSRGQLEIESKADLRQRGIPSPDQADAVALAFAPAPPAPPALFMPAALGSRRTITPILPPLRLLKPW